MGPSQRYSQGRLSLSNCCQLFQARRAVSATPGVTGTLEARATNNTSSSTLTCNVTLQDLSIYLGRIIYSLLLTMQCLIRGIRTTEASPMAMFTFLAFMVDTNIQNQPLCDNLGGASASYWFCFGIYLHTKWRHGDNRRRCMERGSVHTIQNMLTTESTLCRMNMLAISWLH